jgi:hypothetical protein
MALSRPDTPLAGPVEPCLWAAPTCYPAHPLRACENSFVFEGLREGEGGGGGYHHLFPGISKLIAFDFAPPPPTCATCQHGMAACCWNTSTPKSSFAGVFVRAGIDLVFSYGVTILKNTFTNAARPLPLSCGHFGIRADFHSGVVLRPTQSTTSGV